MKSQTSGKYTYRISPIRMAAVGIPLFLFVVAFLVVGAISREESLIFVGAMIAVVTSPLWMLIYYTRLRLSEDGVELRQFGYRLQTIWDNIEAMEQAAGAQGFILKAPINSPAAKRLRDVSELTILSNGVAMSPYMGGHRELVAQGRFIPIEAFGFWLRYGDLRNAIQTLAPHVNFVVAPSPRPLPLKNKLLIVGLIGLGVTLGLLMACDGVPRQTRELIGSAIVGIQGTALGVLGVTGLISSFMLFRRRRWMTAIFSSIAAILTLLSALYCLIPV